jgi:hypothetical protein
MAEKNLFTLEDLNLGTTVTNTPDLDSSTNLPAEKPNLFTLEDLEKGVPLTENQRTRNPNPYDSINYSNIYTDPIKRYSKYGIPLTRYNNWDESRASAQSTWDKWGNGLAKMGLTTLGAFTENTIGVLFGLGEMAVGSGYYYDNFIGNQVDKINEWARINLPNYKSIEEQRMNTLDKLGTANFWADTVANGIGYSLGSIAAVVATSGVGLLGRVGKIFGLGNFGKTGSAAYNASKAIATGTQLAGATNKLSKGQRALNAINYAEVGLYMSMAEASVEARETQRRTYEDLMELEKERSGFVSPEKEQDILEASYSAGNTDFLLQLPVLAGTNLLMFGNLMMGYRGATRRNADVIWGNATGKAINTLADRGRWRNTLGRLRPSAVGAATEAAQEGWQFASKIAAMDYHYDKYFDGGTEDFSKSISKGLEELVGTQEGLESMLVGAIVGGGVSGFRSVTDKPYAQRQKNAQQLTDILNGGYLADANGRRLNANAMAKATADMETALKNGDEAGYINAQNRLVGLNALDIIPRGGLDVFMQKMDDAAQMSDVEFAKAFGYNPDISIGAQVGKTKQEIVDDLKNKFKKFQEIYESINYAYSATPPVPGEAGTLSPLLKMRMSKEERDAYTKQENERSNLRNSLTLSLFGIELRNAKMQELQNEMHNLLNSTVNLVNGTPILGGEFNIYDMAKPKKGEEFNAEEEFKRYQERQNEIFQKLLNEKADPIKIQEFVEKSNQYRDLFSANLAGVEAYNNLNSPSFLQGVFNNRLQEIEEEAQAKAKANKNKEAVENAKTTKEMEDNVEDLEGEVKSAAESKYKDLERSEEEVKDSYLRKVAGLSTTQALQNLKTIDTTELTEIEKAGLIRAIDLLEESVGRQDAAPPVEEAQDLDSEIFEQEKVEQDDYNPQPVDVGEQLDIFEDVTVTQTEETALPGVELAIDPSMWTLTSRGTNKQIGVDANGNIVYSRDTEQDQRENGSIIETNIGPLLGDTKGVEVEFEIIETKWFIENHKGKETENEQIPVYVKIDGVYVGKLKANTSEGRIAIINKLKAGEKVTSKISSIWSNNYNNAVLSEATSTTYFYNVKDQFGDGDTNNVLLAITTGGVDETDAPQWQIVGGEQKNIDNLESVKAQAQTDQPAGTRVNQIAAVTMPYNTPGGKPRVVVLSTANLSGPAKLKVLELITNRDYTAAREIVATSAITRTSQGREASFLEFNVFQNGEKYLVYYSPELQKLVRVTESEMTKGLRGQKAIVTVVEIKDGTYSQVTKTSELNIAQDFSSFLDTKKYHVDKEKSNNQIEKYTSPVTGKQYDNYQEYLFDSAEVDERVTGQGHSAILSTDIVKMDQSLFNNPKVTFERGDIMGETKQEIIDNVTFPAAEITDTTTPQSVKDRFNKKNCK